MTIESIENSPKKLKNRWLIYTLICYFILPIFMSVLFAMREDLFKGFESLLFLLLFSAASFFPLYYFAYKKPGTRLLTFSIALNAFYIVSLSVILLVGISIDLPNTSFFKERVLQDLPEGIHSFKIIAFFHFIGLGLWIRWMRLSIQLRALNRRIQEKFDPYERCKKDWLISTVLCCVGYPIYQIMMLPSFYFENFFDVMSSLYKSMSGYELLSIIPYSVLFSTNYTFLYILLAIPFVYYCAYKKAGIRLLSFVLAGQSVLVITSFAGGLNVLFDHTHALHSLQIGMFIVSLFINLFFQIWWIILSYRLLKMNMAIRSEIDPNVTFPKKPLIFTALFFFGVKHFIAPAGRYFL